MSQKAAHRENSRDLILADLKTAFKWTINILFAVVFFILMLELKSILQIDIFPNYDFPLDEIVRDLF
ncbi:MAG: hypothetical protein HWE21_04675 [Cytophagia bacterium]|nr:hypothetical protein [Cytophagia bacterium]